MWQISPKAPMLDQIMEFRILFIILISKVIPAPTNVLYVAMKYAIQVVPVSSTQVTDGR